MKILIDIGHPAHVHYFKNFIWKMREKGHTIDIISRNKEVAFNLLEYYQFSYYDRGKGRNGLIGKLIYIFQADFFLFRKAMLLKPDVYLSAGSPYAAHVAWLTGKPHIAIDDTDNNAFQHAMYVPFTKIILTPKVFTKNFGKKHIRFNGFLELFSLHPKRFVSLPQNVEKLLHESENKKIVILRFVSWDATHDKGLEGLKLEDKYKLVKELNKYAKVIISSESKLPKDLEQYSYKVHPAFMHDLLNVASLLVSESLTMSAESAFIGTPTICISTATAGTLDEEVKLGLIELYRKSEGLVERAVEIMKDENYKVNFKTKSREIVGKMIDSTAFLMWLVENYPNSFSTLKQNPEFQQTFL